MEQDLNSDLKQNLKSEQVIVLTVESLIEGSLHYHKDVRLSDALNSPYLRENPYVALNDVRVLRLASGEEILRVRFLLVARSQILCIMPKSEVVAAPMLDPSRPKQTAITATIPVTPTIAPKDRRGALRRRGSPTAILITDAAATTTPFGGWVVERSRTGLGMLVDRLIGVGTRLNVKPSDAAANFPWILVDVKSCRPDKDSARLGCRFVSKVPWAQLLKFG